MGHSPRSLVPVNTIAHSLFAVAGRLSKAAVCGEIRSRSLSQKGAPGRARPTCSPRGTRCEHARDFSAPVGANHREADILSESGKSHS
ncbi:diguanylate cyclase [Burkholderia pseudomallei]|uniref:diguanylate cyclase n=1 Tax=Burkholderia pseudomallei TaxID=28450 RepID=UPI000A1A0ADC|nr:diguanylate cyclase [Burkholderia pseudomallei]ARK76014.1 diguanylate cyclase [Burkholderia pseudomallei]